MYQYISNFLIYKTDIQMYQLKWIANIFISSV